MGAEVLRGFFSPLSDLQMSSDTRFKIKAERCGERNERSISSFLDLVLCRENRCFKKRILWYMWLGCFLTDCIKCGAALFLGVQTFRAKRVRSGETRTCEGLTFIPTRFTLKFWSILWHHFVILLLNKRKKTYNIKSIGFWNYLFILYIFLRYWNVPVTKRPCSGREHTKNSCIHFFMILK